MKPLPPIATTAAAGNATKITAKVDNTLLSRRYEQLLLSEKYTDCMFDVCGVTMRAHKLVLSAASPVFEAMFYGNFVVEHVIDILDMSAETFRTLLLYVYAGRVDYDKLTLEQTIELYYGAEKYLLSDLIADCLLAIARKLRFANVLAALELSVCLDLRGLLEVCMSFFTRCCLGDAEQFALHLKQHYVHISKECVKMIIALNGEQQQQQLLWFIYEWCQHECQALGLPSSEAAALVIDDLQLPATVWNAAMGGGGGGTQQQHAQCKTIERSYYKACRPFTVDSELPEWRIVLKSDRFIALNGVVLHSRLTPGMAPLSYASEYAETLHIEISTTVQALTAAAAAAASSSAAADASALASHSDGEDSDHEAEQEQQRQVIWRHSISKQTTKYNCNLNVNWEKGVVLSPDVEYELKLCWQSDAYGAEYPCCLQSNRVDGIEFRDFGAQFGSLMKGVRFTNLI